VAIQPITMPKWGLAMEEGVLARWAVDEGAEIAAGQEIMDIETTKIANVFESPVAGVLRRKVVSEGETVPVGALLGVVSDPGVAEAEVDAFIGDFLDNFKPAEKGASGAPTPKTVEVKGGRIRYLKAGPEDGTPILMIHGFGADLMTWMFNQAELAQDRPVYAIDLPGHGGSGKDVGKGSLEALAAAVLAFMDALGIARAHLVGHSLGGAVAVEMALTSPDRVTAVTLIAPAGFGTEISREFIEGFIGESRARKLRPILEMLVADPAMVTGDMVEEVLKFKRLDGAVAALRAIADANFDNGTQRIALRERLGELTIPVRVIWGEADRILPARHADGLPQNVRVTHIVGAGHIPHLEKAAEITALIKNE
jgi:pyruvate dehydrogenase E2 component (dihydrolipoamide acetyltransferase)